MITNPTEGWELVESSFRPEHAKAWEGLFTLGSGYLHVRGSLEENLGPQNRTYTRMPANVTSETFAQEKSKWGTYVPGVFGRHPLLNNEMINLPWFLGLAPAIDGERLDLEACAVTDYRRRLSLRDATLERSLTWHTRSGRTVRVVYERFVSAVRPGLCVQRLSVRADGKAGLQVMAGIDADVRTNGYDHFTSVDCRPERGGRGGLCEVLTDAGDRVTIVSSLASTPPVACEFAMAERGCGLLARATPAAGGEVVFEKRTVVATSRDPVPRDAVRELSEADGLTWDQLRDEQAAAWQRRWASCDVRIEGDAHAQLAMRASLFHLLRGHVPGDPRVAIDAKGYAGEAYWGRFFWDTEMFLLPFYVCTDPPRARTLADFRVQSLPGARTNAARYGYPGARYAWESDAAGIECCPNWQYGDHEVHVTADVVYGLVHYARATGDEGYLRGPAAAVLVETARYWMDTRPGDGHPSVLGVMGPDEYTPISNNNSYTNMMVAEALRAAAEFGEAAGATTDERAAFRKTADSLPLPRAADDLLVLQCEDFERLAEPEFDRIWPDRRRTLGAQVSQERLYRIKALKQADVLMLMSLYPQRFTDAEVRRAWDYYLPYTTHDSSLSAGVHAILAARLGMTEAAWAFWQHGTDIDLDVASGGPAEGIHIANAGAVWQMAVFGFAGFRTAMQADVLTLNPRLPDAWSRLAFPLAWKGGRVGVEITRAECRVANQGPGELEVCVAGEPRRIACGEAACWELPA
jgi:kojibiose phosphorylase